MFSHGEGSVSESYSLSDDLYKGLALQANLQIRAQPPRRTGSGSKVKLTGDAERLRSWKEVLIQSCGDVHEL